MATGEIEVYASDLVIYSEADTPPIYVKDDDHVSEDLRLKYRYLDLRNTKNHDNIVKRSQIIRHLRRKMEEKDFLEIQ
ncbi:MAG: Asp-tRNA(Asn)/Glu-tRNA(Gln) amidotransferase GatCAB subunit C, partial [Firmicutes bacterium]|nr:Asp-tRNA(Asn)/Glu-tRNA(Gln) amidotransferase GatCAB subunit C [Bacillota bacterium]